jgi:hypothetical protein
LVLTRRRERLVGRRVGLCRLVQIPAVRKGREWKREREGEERREGAQGTKDRERKRGYP